MLGADRPTSLTHQSMNARKLGLTPGYRVHGINTANTTDLSIPSCWNISTIYLTFWEIWKQLQVIRSRDKKGIIIHQMELIYWTQHGRVFPKFVLQTDPGTPPLSSKQPVSMTTNLETNLRLITVRYSRWRRQTVRVVIQIERRGGARILSRGL